MHHKKHIPNAFPYGRVLHLFCRAMTWTHPGSVAAGAVPKVCVATAVVRGVRGPQTTETKEQKLTLLGAGRDFVSGLKSNLH